MSEPKKQELLGPLELGRDREAFLREVAAAEPATVASLFAMLPEWSESRLSPGGIGRRREMLAKWMDRFNLRAPWMPRAMGVVLSYWAAIPPKERPTTWPRVIRSSVYWMPDLPASPAVNLPPWQPDEESAENYVDRAAVVAKRVARQYTRTCAELLRSSEGGEWRAARRIRGGGPKRQESPRWRWLALFQLCGKSYFDIADGEVEASTVRKSVAAAAARIDLKLRR